MNSVQLDIVEGKLISIGFQPVKARLMSRVLMSVANDTGTDPLSYFDDPEQALKLANDAYQVINLLRPPGNQIGVKKPINNKKSRYAKLIKP